jgi:hypothetical protein
MVINLRLKNPVERGNLGDWYKWENNINLELKSLGCEEVYLAKVAKDINKMWTSTYVVTNIRKFLEQFQYLR